MGRNIHLDLTPQRGPNWGAFLSPYGLLFVGGLAVCGYGLGKLGIESKWSDLIDKSFAVGNQTPFGTVAQAGAVLDGLINIKTNIVFRDNSSAAVCSLEPWFFWVQAKGDGSPSSESKCEKARDWLYEQDRQPQRPLKSSALPLADTRNG